MLVIDASVALKWVFDEEGWEMARAILGRSMTMAPTLVLAEIGNAAWRLTQQGKIPPSQAEEAIAVLPRFFHSLVPIDRLYGAAFEAARTLGHPIYDCFYLALAKANGTSVITADRRLAERVRGTAWDVVELL